MVGCELIGEMKRIFYLYEVNNTNMSTKTRTIHIFGFIENSMNGSFIKDNRVYKDNRVDKDNSKNRDDEPYLQYLPLCAIKNNCCYGIGMHIRENRTHLTGCKSNKNKNQ